MYARSLAGVVLAAAMFVPFAASAQTQPDLKSQIQALLAQIAALSQQITSLKIATSTPTAVTSSSENSVATVRCPALGRPLSAGMSGDDVLGLQHFLSDEGVLSSDSFTGYFGAKTRAAVIAWQSSQGIVSSDAVVGPKTRSAISAVCGDRLAAPGLPSSSLTISLAPEALSISALATVNVGNACNAQTYVLDWGDASSSVTIPVAAGACAAVAQTYTHTYDAAGYYTVTVGSGASQVSAHVEVGQAPSCIVPNFGTTTPPVGTVGSSYLLPLISFPDTDGSLTLASTPLPDGLSLVDMQSTSTGSFVHTWTIAGKPTAATTTDITISAHDDCGTAQTSFTLPVH